MMATIKQSKKALNSKNKNKSNNKEALLSILNVIPDCVYLIDKNGNINWANTAACNMQSTEKTGLTGQKIFSLLPAEIKTKFKNYFEKAIKTQKHIQFEDLKSIKCIEYNLQPLLNENGKVSEIVFYGKNITDSKQKEEILKESEEKYRLLYEMAGVGIANYSPEGIILSYNQIAAMHMNGKPEDFTGKSIYNIFSKADADLYFNRIKKAIKSTYPEKYVDKVDLPAGVKWFHSTFNRIVNSAGKIIGIQIISTDISEHIQTEEALKQSGEWYRQLLDNSNDAIYVHLADKDLLPGLFTEVNKLACTRLGYTRDELLRMSPLDIDAPEFKDHIVQVAQTLKEKGRCIFEMLHVTKSGQRIPVEINAHCFSLGENRVVMSIARDITERKRSEKELIEINSLLSQFIKHSPIYAFIKSVKPGESRVIYASENYKDMIGIPGSAMAGKTMQEMFHAEFAEKITKDDWEVVSAGNILTTEETLNDKNYITIKFPIREENRNLLAGYTIDITDRKHTEEALRESEARYRLISEYSTDVIWLYDLALNKFTFMSPAVERLRGYSVSEVLKESMLDSLTPESRKLLTQQLPERIKAFTMGDESVRTQIHEVAQICKDGSTVITEVVSTLITDQEGRLTYIQGVSRDITKRKHTEEKLQKSEAMLRAQLDNSPDVIMVINKQLKFLSINKIHFTSKKIEDFIGKDAFEPLPEHVRDKVRNKVNECFKTGKTREIEHEIGNKWAMARIVPIFSGEDINEVMVISTDITEQKQSEESLRKSEAKFRAIIENIHDGITFIEPDSTILYRSPSYNAITGFSDEERIGKTGLDLIHPDDAEKMRNSLKECIKNPVEIFKGTYRLIHKDGTWRYVETTAKNLLDNPDIKAVLLTTRDITKDKLSEIMLNETSERLSLAAKAAKLGIWDWNVPDNFIVWDDRMSELYGITRDALPNNVDAWISRIHPEDMERAIDEWGKALSGEKEFDMEFRVVHPNGKVVHIKTNGLVIRDNNGKALRMIGINSDITERKQAEMELFNEKLFTEKLLESMPGIFFLYDSTCHLKRWNKAHETTMGFTADELRDWYIPDWHKTPEDAAIGMALVKSVLETGVGGSFETTLINKKRQFVPYLISVTRLLTSEGPFMMGVGIDITERKKIEESLLTSEERFKNIVQSLTDYIYTMKIESGNIVKTTHGPGSSGVTGYTPEEFEADPYLWYNMIHPDDREYATIQMKKILAGEKVQFIEHRIIHKNRTTRWIRNTLVPSEEDGHITGYDGLISDITERKQAEEALKLSEKKYRDIFERAIEGIFQSSYEGKFINVNPSFAHVLGYNSPDELLLTITSIQNKLFVNPEDYNYFLGKITKEDKIEAFEHQFFKKDGTKIWLSINARAERDTDGRILYFEGIVEDISRRKQAEDEKERLENQLRQAQKMEALGTFVGGIAHDFNNILSVLMGYTQLIQTELDTNNPLNEYVQQIFSSSEKAANLTKSLLAFSRKQPITQKPVNLNEVIMDIDKILKRLITEDISLNIKLHKDKIMITGDPSQLDQIFFNLATNARDAMPKGGKIFINTSVVELDTELTQILGYGTPGKYALVTFSDNGIGMDEKTKEQIFDPFFTTKEVGKGTGLGMATVYGIIKQHGGYISIYSELGSGTAFNMYFPLSSDINIKEKRNLLRLQKGNETILVAEDNDSVRLLINSTLTKFGYKIIEAVDGEDALNKFKNIKNPDLVILDSVMPKKNGREVFDEIRKINPEIKVLFCSGYTQDVILLKGIEEKEFDFISKPLTPNGLLGKIREILDRK
jgi:two-component system, cell cycle sensor histidine kinase and response regulator CckA